MLVIIMEFSEPNSPKRSHSFMRQRRDTRLESGGKDGLEALLDTFPVVGLRVGAVLIVGVASSLGDGSINIILSLCLLGLR